jgi:hypothetical protein
MLIPNRLSLEEIPRRARPIAVAETIIVHLCMNREATNPDPRRDMKYPNDIKRKSEPASECPRLKSFSMVGSRGARIILPRKFRKKIPAKKRMGPMYDPKDVFSILVALSEFWRGEIPST